MTMIQFTNNINDRSTEAGFQFEFKCDRCHTGCMSSFKPSKMGIASGVLRATGSLFSGGAAASGALNADSQRISPTAQAALESGAGV